VVEPGQVRLPRAKLEIEVMQSISLRMGLKRLQERD
jgi:hypothetical protein